MFAEGEEMYLQGKKIVSCYHYHYVFNDLISISAFVRQAPLTQASGYSCSVSDIFLIYTAQRKGVYVKQM